jgi:hypothetical protein
VLVGGLNQVPIAVHRAGESKTNLSGHCNTRPITPRLCEARASVFDPMRVANAHGKDLQEQPRNASYVDIATRCSSWLIS